MAISGHGRLAAELYGRFSAKRVLHALQSALQDDLLSQLFAYNVGDQAVESAAVSENKCGGDIAPIELETLDARRHPDLPNGRVRAYNELRGRIFELNGEGALVAVDLKIVLIGGAFEGALQGRQGFVGSGAEFIFVDHMFTADSGWKCLSGRASSQ